MKLRYEANVLGLYEEAKRKHQAKSGGSMPWWGWLLLLYLGYDDIFRLLGSYMFFPTILVIILIVLMQTSPYLRPLNTILYMFKDRVVDEVKKRFGM